MALAEWTRNNAGALRRPLAGGELSVHALSTRLQLANVIAGCTVTGVEARSEAELETRLRSGALAVRYRWPNIACTIVAGVDGPEFEYAPPSSADATAWARRTVRTLSSAEAADAPRALNRRVSEDNSFAIWLDAHDSSCVRLLYVRVVAHGRSSAQHHRLACAIRRSRRVPDSQRARPLAA